MKPRTDPRIRFWAKVDKSGECWLWTAATANGGYGVFVVDGDVGKRYAHRLSYEYLVGPIPEGLVIDHLCRNPSCVNPAHLEPVTNAENLRRGLGGQWGKSKTHCPHGHPYDEVNTRWNRRSYGFSRTCRTCERERRRTA